MKPIALDVSQTSGNKAGCGYYADCIVRGLLKYYPKLSLSLFTTWGAFYRDPINIFKRTYSSESISYPLLPLRFLKNSTPWCTKDELDEVLRDYSLIHINNFWHPPFKLHIPSLYTLYDLSFVQCPEWTTEANRIGCLEGMINGALYADYFLAISESTKHCFLRFFPFVNPEKVRVIYPYSRFSDNGYKLTPPDALLNMNTPPFFLCVGTVEPRKNQSLLLEAYNRYRSLTNQPVPIVFVGKYGWLMNDFDKQRCRSPYYNEIIFLDYVNDCQLAWLYSHCLACFYPSLYEGFGLPILEAITFGKPIICSNTTSMPEIVGKYGAILDPTDVNSWSAQMESMASSKKNVDELSDNSHRRQSAFNPSLLTKSVHDLYLEIVGNTI